MLKTEKPKETQITESQVFGLPILYRIVTAIFFPFGGSLPFVALAIWLTQNTEFFWLSVIGTWATLTTVFGYAIFRYWDGYRLIVSPNGIIYRAPSYEIKATWIQIKRLAYEGGIEGLYVPDAVIQDTSKARFFEKANRDSKFIPIGRFATWGWWRGPIGKLLRKYAPHIFADGTAGKKPV